MATAVVGFACAQCGGSVTDLAALASWLNGKVALDGDFPETVGQLLLCPDCVDEEHRQDFEQGEGD